MKKSLIIASNLAVCLLTGASLLAADQMTTLTARSGSKMRIEGTSSIHDWQTECPIIGGSLQVGKNFPLEAGQAVTPGKVEATGDIFIPVSSFSSKKKDGSHYSDDMDKVMIVEHLLSEKYPRITYHLTELTLKEVPKDKASPYIFESTGDLAVAGVTNKISMPVDVLFTEDKDKKPLIKITGSKSVKMTDFKIEPPSPKIIPIKTGDEVKLIFEWNVAPKKPAASS